MSVALAVFANEFRRRMLDRSLILTAFVAPLVITGILGFAFGAARVPAVTVGVAFDSPAGALGEPLVKAAGEAAGLPPDVTITVVSTPAALRRELAGGIVQGGVVVNLPSDLLKGHRSPPTVDHLARLLVPVVAPGTGDVGAGLDVLAGSSVEGSAASSALASGLASRLAAAALASSSAHPGRIATTPPALVIDITTLGTGPHRVIDYFAPSIAVIFVFIGAGLGARALLLERAAGTLVRLAAAPVRASVIVLGKLLTLFAISLLSIGVVWGATALAFGAHWGSPLGVIVLSVAAVTSMTALAVFLTSFARTEREALGVAMVLGLVFSLLGGSLLPPGVLPRWLQIVSLGTPNGWALIGYGRLSLERLGAAAIVVPSLVLFGIGVVFGLLASLRLRRMVAP